MNSIGRFLVFLAVNIQDELTRVLTPWSVDSRILERGTNYARESQRVRVTLRLTIRESVLAMSPSGTRDQILAIIRTFAVLLLWGRLPWREDRSVLYQVTDFVCVLIYMYVFILQVFFTFQLLFNNLLLLRPAVPILYRRFCLRFICCSRT